ncbi:MAG TPA: hypothetical protein ENO00_10450 [Deltaproteobacteria bacterium]|nr:hypothetical protein [Deltaproteobacteria bacterium]
MKNFTLKSLPVSSLAYLGIGIVILLTFVTAIICPSLKQLNRLDGEISDIQGRINSQKVLLPLYFDLVKKSEEKVPDTLLLPEKKVLPKESIDLIPSLFKGIAGKSGMDLVAVNPDFTTFARGGGAILINTVARGDFSSVRMFLVELGKVPYVKQVEEMEIRQRANNKELKLTIWLQAG